MTAQDWPPADIAYEWWRTLRQREAGPAPGALARLRRAGTPLDVMQEPEALRLIVSLGGFGIPRRVAVLAGVLALVRENGSVPVARAVGRKTLAQRERAVLSQARFRHLLQSGEEERMEHMRRLVRVLKGKAHVRSLADAVLFWDESVKQRWIFEYYGVAETLAAGGESTSGAPECRGEPANG